MKKIKLAMMITASALTAVLSIIGGIQALISSIEEIKRLMSSKS